MCRNCLLNSPLMIVAEPRSQFHMKLKPGFKIPFMAVFPTFFLSNNRLVNLSTVINKLIYIQLQLVVIFSNKFTLLQVINLQAQLASAKEQAAKSYSNGSDNSIDPSWLQYSENLNKMPQNLQNPNSFGSDENIMVPEVLNDIYGSFGEASNSMSSLHHMHTNSMQWSFDQD